MTTNRSRFPAAPNADASECVSCVRLFSLCEFITRLHAVWSIESATVLVGVCKRQILHFVCDEHAVDPCAVWLQVAVEPSPLPRPSPAPVPAS